MAQVGRCAEDLHSQALAFLRDAVHRRRGGGEELGDGEDDVESFKYGTF